MHTHSHTINGWSLVCELAVRLMASEIAHLFLESSYHVMFVLRDSEPYSLSV